MRSRALLGVALALTLTACGGSGSGSKTDPKASGSSTASASGSFSPGAPGSPGSPTSAATGAPSGSATTKPSGATTTTPGTGGSANAIAPNSMCAAEHRKCMTEAEAKAWFRAGFLRPDNREHHYVAYSPKDRFGVPTREEGEFLYLILVYQRGGGPAQISYADMPAKGTVAVHVQFRKSAPPSTLGEKPVVVRGRPGGVTVRSKDGKSVRLVVWAQETTGGYLLFSSVDDPKFRSQSDLIETLNALKTA